MKCPNPENPLECLYDEKLDALVPLYPSKLNLMETNDEHELLIPTVSLQVAYSIISPWLHNKEHVLVVGPEACGKRYQLKYSTHSSFAMFADVLLFIAFFWTTVCTRCALHGW